VTAPAAPPRDPEIDAPPPGGAPLPLLEERRPGPGRLAGFVALLVMVAAGLAVFSAFPWVATPPGVALLKIAVKHVAAPVGAAVALSREELEKLPRHMRPAGGQSAESRARRDTTVRVTLDGRPVLERTYRPSGLRGDGPTFVYEEVELRPGPHRLEATLLEAGGPSERSDAPAPFERRLSADVDVASGQVLLLEISGQRELTLRR
jgi:hypothetical protein